LLSPLTAICLGYLLLAQTLTLLQLTGALVVFAGILLSQRSAASPSSIR